MHPNPVLKRLGFSDHDRVVIIHTDDIGMSHASYAAFTDLWKAGIVSSGATMVPCSWFPKVAAFCRSIPNVDMGVHLTLTCEWDMYRWGPISSREPGTGLLDEEGYFPRATKTVHESADPDAVCREFQAQLERAIAVGVRPTHVDTHMGAVMHPKFIPAYFQLALQHKLPAMLVRLDEAGLRRAGFEGESLEFAVKFLRMIEGEALMPLLDHITGMPLDKPERRFEQVCHALDQLQPGVTHFIIHPSQDTPEARAISPDLPNRIGDYETFMDERVRDHIRTSGLQVIGYRHLKALMN